MLRVFVTTKWDILPCFCEIFQHQTLHKSAQNAGQNATDKIAKKCNGHSPSKALDFGFGKVHSGNVEHSFATAHDDGGAVANVAIHSVSFVDIR